MANLIPQDIREWMRRMEFKTNDLTRRMNNLIPGDISTGVDLNGYMSSGRWRRPSAVGTTTALHYPFDGASGTLEVYWEPTNLQVHQVWHDRSGSRHSRWWNGNTWSNWDGVWVDITTGFSAGVTPQTGDNTPQAMRQGRIVAVRGRVTVAGGGPGGPLNFGQLPNGFEPRAVVEMGNGSISGTQTSRYFVSTSGLLQVTGWPASQNNTTGALSGTFGIG